MRLVDIFYENINGDIFYTDIKGDIFYKDIKGDIFLKDIKGQASDIKGNLNAVGHLMMLGVDDVAVPFVSGYFEIDDSIVHNASKNYPKLFNLLRSDVPNIDNIADVQGDLIVLGAYPSLLTSRGRGNAVIGSHTLIQHEAHNHSYLHIYQDGDYLRTGSSNTVSGLPTYIMRLFIYHGVHV